ncbi:MAG: helix-turn-helix transcriptional regulator [Leptospirales bacterium]|nr:helix-turn-helix transcriptional regulator [Leptospirales bacterium]
MKHSHPTEAICAGVDAKIKIRGQGVSDWRETQTAFLPSHCEHEIQIPEGRFASLLFEPGGGLSETVKRQVYEGGRESTRIVCDPPPGDLFLEFLKSLEPDSSSEYQEAAFDSFLGRIKPTPAIDARIVHVAEQILKNPVPAMSIDSLANSIGMSVSWLVHAFSDSYNLPIRKYRNYVRLKAVANLLNSGESLAAAAVGAGFYDQAHFNNTFRELFGLQPGLIFSQPHGIRWHIDNPIQPVFEEWNPGKEESSSDPRVRTGADFVER